MKLIRGLYNLRSSLFHHCVMTIGNFDGVHRGHQALLKQLKKEGKNRNLPTIVMIFEPHPSELFFGKKAPARLTQFREKLYRLSQCNVDYVLCIRFNWNFAALTANEFIKDFLVKYLNVQFLIVGDDFRFGANRTGDFLLLKNASFKYGFKVINVHTLCENGTRISSTVIRQALSEAQLEKAENLLGYPFSICGRIIHGNALGRSIGYPTANLTLHHHVSPIEGVYTVEVDGIKNTLVPGIANIGIRPTISGNYQQLEVHLLDIKMDLYGHHINVIFRKKIRSEQKFSSIDELKQQIAQDELITRTLLTDYATNFSVSKNVKIKSDE